MLVVRVFRFCHTLLPYLYFYSYDGIVNSYKYYLLEVLRFFNSKLVVLQTLCRINNKPLTRGIYGIPIGDILDSWCTCVQILWDTWDDFHIYRSHGICLGWKIITILLPPVPLRILGGFYFSYSWEEKWLWSGTILVLCCVVHHVNQVMGCTRIRPFRLYSICPSYVYLGGLAIYYVYSRRVGNTLMIGPIYPSVRLSWSHIINYMDNILANAC